MPKQHILIAGAGIAGLALAVQLYTHAKDYYDVSVFEKTPYDEYVANAGYVIILSPNAVHVLRQLDIDLVKAGCAMPLNRTVIHHALHPHKIVAEAHNLFADPSLLLSVERGAFQQLLYQRLVSLGGKVHFGTAITDITTTAAPAYKPILHLTSPTTTTLVAGDFLVGADGVHSRVRQALYTTLLSTGERAPTPSSCPFGSIFPISLFVPLVRLFRGRRHGREAWRARPTPWTALYGITPPLPAYVLTRDTVRTGLGTMHWWLPPAGAGAYTTYSLQRGRVSWICYGRDTRDGTGNGGGGARESSEEYDALPYAPSTRADCEALPLGEFSAVTQASKDEGKDEGESESESKDESKGESESAPPRRCVRLWHTIFHKISNAANTVVLIGDAAHPMVTFHGQGGGMGLEESVVLTNAFLREAWSHNTVNGNSDSGEHGDSKKMKVKVKVKEVEVEVEVGEKHRGIPWFLEQRSQRSRRVSELGWWFGVASMGDSRWIRWLRDWIMPWFLAAPNPMPRMRVEKPTENDTKPEKKMEKEEKEKEEKEEKEKEEKEEKEKEKKEKEKKEKENEKERNDIVREKEGENWLFDLKLMVETREEFLASLVEKQKKTTQVDSGAIGSDCGGQVDPELECLMPGAWNGGCRFAR